MGDSMGHKNKKTLIRQVDEVLNRQFDAGKGRSKHIDKGFDAGTLGKIYSEGTLTTYKRNCCYFVRWCKHRYGCRTLKECKEHAAEWISEQQKEGLSAWTLKTRAASIAKLYGVKSSDLGIVTPSRRRSDIKRSRHKTKSDAHFSERKNYKFVIFGRCTGLRRREMGRIRGNALFLRNGIFCLRVTDGTKGGRHREAPIVGSPEEVALVVSMLSGAGSGKVFDYVPKGMDEHANRKEYANRVYQKYKRPLSLLRNDQKYFCRGDLRGVVYDRRAMLRASEALGHSRLNIIASNYTPDP